MTMMLATSDHLVEDPFWRGVVVGVLMILALASFVVAVRNWR